MATFEPIVPQPGWFWRWTRQGLALLGRSGEALALLVGALALIGTVLMLAIDAAATLPRGWIDPANTIGYAFGALLGAPVAVVFLALIRRADTGEPPAWGTIVESIRTTPWRIAKAVAIYLVVGAIVPNTPSNATSFLHGFVHQGGNLWTDALLAGILALNMGIHIQVFDSALAYALAIASGASTPQIRAFDVRMVLRLHLVRFAIFGVFLGVQIFALAASVLGLPILAIFLAWSYVGARELTGGGAENTPVRQTRTAPLPAAT